MDYIEMSIEMNRLLARMQNDIDAQLEEIRSLRRLLNFDEQQEDLITLKKETTHENCSRD